MKYCEICAGENEDNALECKYCHSVFKNISDNIYVSEDTGVTDLNNSDNFVNSDKKGVNSMGTDYFDNMSVASLVLWSIAFCIVPIFGIIMTNIVWGKLGNKNLYIMRLASALSLFVPFLILFIAGFIFSFISI